MPAAVGTRSATTIAETGTRFGDKLAQPMNGDADDGTVVVRKNGVHRVSYRYVPEIGRCRVGDTVPTCLVSVPEGRPKGDDRGKICSTTHLRTQESWMFGDSHLCCGT